MGCVHRCSRIRAGSGRNFCAGSRAIGAKDGVIRSVLFDTKGAAAARERALPQYIESIVVEGRDPDAPPRKLVPLEHRFAQTLLAPSAASAYGLRAPDTRPCMSLASAWNPSFANNFVPLSGCPR